jgi:hypothetical protein
MLKICYYQIQIVIQLVLKNTVATLPIEYRDTDNNLIFIQLVADCRKSNIVEK